MAPNDSPALFSLLTPLGEGGISLIALSGPRSLDTIRPLFRGPRRPLPESPAPGKLYYGHLYEGDELLDEVLLAYHSPEESPTGSEMIEINCHGGITPARAVLDALRRSGAQETDFRGLLLSAADSGKLDQIQAQAALLIPAAPSPRAAALLLAQYRGALSSEISRIAALLDDAQIQPARDRLRALLARWQSSRKLLSPPVIAIAGKTNVGKSTLLNRLLGYDRAITRDEPGTTRDHVAERLGAQSAVLELVDTAGLGGPDNSISREAQRRTLSILKTADLVLFLFSSDQPLSERESNLLTSLAKRPLIPVAAKSDLGKGPAINRVARITGKKPLPVSSLAGIGLEELKGEITRSVALPSTAPDEPAPFTQQQADLLREIIELIESRSSSPAELARRAAGRLHSLMRTPST